MKRICLLITVLVCGYASNAFSQTAVNSIGVNFYTALGTDPSEPINSGTGPEIAGTDFSAAGTAVVNRQDNWNDIPGGPQNGSGSVQSLIDSTGAVVPVAASWSGSDITAIGWPGSSFDGFLLSGALVNTLGGPADLSFSNIPYAQYNVIAYVDWEDAFLDTTLSILDGAGSTVLAGGVAVDDDINGDFSAFSFPGDYDDASIDGIGNFVIFENLTDSNIIVRSDAGGAIAYLNGVQIVQVPEPSSFAALLGAAVLAFVATQRVARRR
jgi:hypothetical protein